MKFPKKSLEYSINLQALYEMEEVVPMTSIERRYLRQWVKSGHDIETNPWNSIDEFGYQLNYLRAFRLEFGISSGPWDFWKGPDAEPDWDAVRNRFNKPDEY